MSQAEQLVYTASETIPDLERQIQQQENVLSVLLGENPNPFPADARLPNSPSPRTFRPAFPRNYSSAGRTSARQKRSWSQPTRKSALQKPRSFPTCRSLGLGGLESNALHQFITAPSETWYAAFNVSQPVFQGGALRSQLRLARANWQETVLSYQQTVQNALEQVSNSLVASQKDREFREQQELLTQAGARRPTCPRCFIRTAARVTSRC